MSKKNIFLSLLTINVSIPIFIGLRNSVKGYKDFVSFSHIDGDTFYGKEAFSKTVRMYLFNAIMLVLLPLLMVGDFIYGLRRQRYRNKRNK